MALILKTNQVNLKDQSGQYRSPVVIADTTTAEHVAAVNQVIDAKQTAAEIAIQNKQNAALAQITDAAEMESMLANTFDATISYTAGQYVIQPVTSGSTTTNKLYRFTADHAAGAWTGTDAEEVVLANDVGDLRSAIDEQSDIIRLKESIPLDGTVDGLRYISYTSGDLGTTATGEYFSHTDYIYVKSFNSIRYKRIQTTSSTPAFGIAFYDETKTYISGQKALARGSALGYVDSIAAVPDGAVFARFTTLNDTTTYGEFSVSGINHLSQLNDLYGIIGDPDFVKSNPYYSNLWQYGTFSSDKAIGGTGTQAGALVDNISYNATDYIPVQEGDIIYGYGLRFWCYDSQKAIVSGKTGLLNNLDTALSNGMHYYVIPSGVAYFRICASKDQTPYQFLLYLVSPFESKQSTETKRKLYCLGDSITRGMYAEQGASSSSGPTDKGYPYWIGRLAGHEVENLGVSGSGWANKGGNNEQESGEVNSITVVDANTFADADIITLAFGVNDWKGASQNIQLGDMTSESGDGTVIGNMKYCIETLMTKKPTAQLIVLLPMNTNRQWTGMREMTLAENWAFGYQYRNDQTLEDYRTAIRQCAEYYNVRVIDLEEVCPINRLNLRNMCGDGLHPTRAFYKQMGEALASLIT